jgi:nucleotide-binding universal stress UspA family protein
MIWWLNELVYKKILVPYDISKPADNALEHALRLEKASPSDTEVIVLHVIPEIPIYPVIEHAIKTRKDSGLNAFQEHTKYVYSAMRNEVIRILDEKKHQYEQQGVRFETEVFQGRPVDRILEYAESNGIELIVMGGTGLSGLSKLVALGSVSRGVVERSKCPVMIVH